MTPAVGESGCDASHLGFLWGQCSVRLHLVGCNVLTLLQLANVWMQIKSYRTHYAKLNMLKQELILHFRLMKVWQLVLHFMNFFILTCIKPSNSVTCQYVCNSVLRHCCTCKIMKLVVIMSWMLFTLTGFLVLGPLKVVVPAHKPSPYNIM